MRGLFTLQKSLKINEGGDFGFYFIDMAMKRGNEAPSAGTRVGTENQVSNFMWPYLASNKRNVCQIEPVMF